jgi:hypothetical protein
VAVGERESCAIRALLAAQRFQDDLGGVSLTTVANKHELKLSGTLLSHDIDE